MEALTKDEVLHVAKLARLNIGELEIEKYGRQLKDILTEIEKINLLDIEGDIMISPTNNQNKYFFDTEGPMLKKEEIFRNVHKEIDNYVVVPRVIND